MIKRISLPKVLRQKASEAHPFPFQIAIQTQELIQGTIFWHISADIAAGEFMRLPSGLNILKSKLLEQRIQEQDWESGWNYLEKYKVLFESTVFKNVLLSIRSYWDWYINKLVQFVVFTQENAGDTLARSKQKDLQRITYKEILEQVSIMEKVCNLDFNISDEIKQYIKEMSLVRNLGLHNRWEVDQIYLDKSSENNKWQIGEIRTFDDKELGLWHKSLIEMINKSCKPIAVKYISAPTYPPETD